MERKLRFRQELETGFRWFKHPKPCSFAALDTHHDRLLIAPIIKTMTTDDQGCAGYMVQVGNRQFVAELKWLGEEQIYRLLTEYTETDEQTGKVDDMKSGKSQREFGWDCLFDAFKDFIDVVVGGRKALALKTPHGMSDVDYFNPPNPMNMLVFEEPPLTTPEQFAEAYGDEAGTWS